MVSGNEPLVFPFTAVTTTNGGTAGVVAVVDAGEVEAAVVPSLPGIVALAVVFVVVAVISPPGFVAAAGAGATVGVVAAGGAADVVAAVVGGTAVPAPATGGCAVVSTAPVVVVGVVPVLGLPTGATVSEVVHPWGKVTVKFFIELL